MHSRVAVKMPKLLVAVLVFGWCLSATDSRAGEPERTAPTDPEGMMGKEAGQVRDDNGLRMKLVWCPPGFFGMEDRKATGEGATSGSAAATPVTQIATQIKVFLTSGYWLGKYEVTQAEWKQVIATEPWKGQKFVAQGDDFPATFVSWRDAMQFCEILTEKEHKAGRLPDRWEYTLPTEAQWERACRARTETRFSFGDDESEFGGYAWFHNNAADAAEEYAHRVGRKRPNLWGLHDMHGNVWEWCRDFYQEELPGGRDPEATREGSSRVIRGGAWPDSPSTCLLPKPRRAHQRGRDIGFRVALSLKAEADESEKMGK